MDYLFAPDRIETPAFTIRSYEPGDGPRLADATNSSYAHLRPFLPWAWSDTTVEGQEHLCRTFRARYLLAEDFVLGIFSPAGDRQLGGCGFHLRGRPVSHGVADIGMWIRADSAGQGLGTAALLTLLAWGFSAWPWQRLTWHCDMRNIASMRRRRKPACSRRAYCAVGWRTTPRPGGAAICSCSRRCAASGPAPANSPPSVFEGSRFETGSYRHLSGRGRFETGSTAPQW